jgi:cyanophycinase
MIWLLGPGFVVAQVFDERFDDWPIKLKIKGTVAMADVASISQEHLRRCFSLAEDKVVGLISDTPLPMDLVSALEQTFKRVLPVSLEQVEELAAADIVVFYSDRNIANKSNVPSLPKRKSIESLLNAGKTLLMIGSDRDQIGKRFFLNVESSLETIEGMDLILDCVLQSNVNNLEEVRNQLQIVLAAYPRTVGIAIEPRTTLILEGRQFRVVGSGNAYFYLPKSQYCEARSFSIAERMSWTQSPREWQVDLTEWRRDAIDRVLPAFPPHEVRTPRVDNGTLVIVGGGRTPKGLMSQFVELAGGVRNAKLVYVPCLEDDVYSGNEDIMETWNEMGVSHTALLHTKDRRVSNADQEFLSPLRDATGIWFGGGRQWNFSDSYYGTTAHRLMKEVLHRGGVIGGSSAGASIQARYLARATPIENFQIMAPGYERGGLGFIDGVAIDQHFSQRNRQPDMESLVQRHPQLLGIGIDESTAIVVKKAIAEVIGKGRVFFYDRQKKSVFNEPSFDVLSDGGAYDLEKRQVIVE